MNIFKWFKRGGYTPQEVTAPANDTEQIGDFAKNVVKIYEMQPSIITLGTSLGIGFTDTISDGNKISVTPMISVSIDDLYKSLNPEVLSIYLCNGVALNHLEADAIFRARNRLEKLVQERKRDEAIALIDKIANKTTNDNTNVE